MPRIATERAVARLDGGDYGVIRPEIPWRTPMDIVTVELPREAVEFLLAVIGQVSLSASDPDIVKTATNLAAARDALQTSLAN